MGKEVQCRYCDYQWLPRVAVPKKCPECQRRWPLLKRKAVTNGTKPTRGGK